MVKRSNSQRSKASPVAPVDIDPLFGAKRPSMAEREKREREREREKASERAAAHQSLPGGSHTVFAVMLPGKLAAAVIGATRRSRPKKY